MVKEVRKGGRREGRKVRGREGGREGEREEKMEVKREEEKRQREMKGDYIMIKKLTHTYTYVNVRLYVRTYLSFPWCSRDSPLAQHHPAPL